MIDDDVIVTIPAGSVEPAVVRLDSPAGDELTATTLEMSAVAPDAPYTWVAAVWVDATPAVSRVARMTTARTWAAGEYVVHVRLDGAQIIRCTNRIQVP